MRSVTRSRAAFRPRPPGFNGKTATLDTTGYSVGRRIFAAGTHNATWRMHAAWQLIYAEWCRRNHKAWMDGKPGPVATMEGHLAKHILPRFGPLLVESIDETTVPEFIADLKRSNFERRKPDGTLIKTYRLSRKTILNVVGIVKLVLGRKVWTLWELDLGKPPQPRQRYFTQEQLKQIIEAAPCQYRVLFAVLAGTAMRIGEAAGAAPRRYRPRQRGDLRAAISLEGAGA